MYLINGLPDPCREYLRPNHQGRNTEVMKAIAMCEMLGYGFEIHAASAPYWM